MSLPFPILPIGPIPISPIPLPLDPITGPLVKWLTAVLATTPTAAPIAVPAAVIGIAIAHHYLKKDTKKV